MSFNLKETALIFLLVLLTGGLVKFFTPTKVVYSTGALQEKLDSLTTLSRNQYLSLDQLKDSLDETTEAFQEFVKENEDDIASYSRIIGQLNLKIDSLDSSGSSTSLRDLANTDTSSTKLYKDTTLTAVSSFGDGLLQAESKGGIRNDSLFLDPPTITQLRKVRIDHVVSVSDDNSRVTSATTSPDFTDLYVESYTTLERKKRFPWTEIIAVASFLLGYLL